MTAVKVPALIHATCFDSKGNAVKIIIGFILKLVTMSGETHFLDTMIFTRT